jgi:hypothetical protein
MKRLLGLALLFSTACSTVGVQVKVKRPAEINVARYQKLIVGPVQGTAQNEGLITLLAKAVVQLASGKNNDAFAANWRGQSADGSDIAQHIQMAVANSGRFAMIDFNSVRTARESGSMTSPTLLITGIVNNQSADDRVTSHQEKDSKGNFSTRYTRNVSAHYDVNVQLMDFSSGEIFFTRSFPCTRNETRSAINTVPDAVDVFALYNKCKDSIASNFAKAIAPYDEMVTAYFRKDDLLPDAPMGIEFAKAGSWDQAIALFQKTADNLGTVPPEVSAKAWWNLGLAFEYAHRFSEARAAITRSASFKSDSGISRELANIERLASEETALQQQQFKPAKAASSN